MSYENEPMYWKDVKAAIEAEIARAKEENVKKLADEIVGKLEPVIARIIQEKFQEAYSQGFFSAQARESLRGWQKGYLIPQSAGPIGRGLLWSQES